MTKRTKESYIGGLTYVHNNLIELNGDGIIIDFEIAMRTALKFVAPNLKVFGCWFHHVQCLRRMMASMKELFELIRTNNDAKAIFRKFQCLALLPASDIERAFIWLLREALEVFKFAQYSQFIDYYKKQWINKVKPHNYSVYLRDTRTTGPAEAFNGKLNKTFKTHGSFFSFVESLQNEEAIKADQFERDTLGTIPRDRRKKYYKQRSLLIEKYSQELERGNINYKKFVNTMASIDNKILYADNEISLHDKEIEITKATDLLVGDDTVECRCFIYVF